MFKPVVLGETFDKSLRVVFGQSIFSPFGAASLFCRLQFNGGIGEIIQLFPKKSARGTWTRRNSRIRRDAQEVLLPMLEQEICVDLKYLINPFGELKIRLALSRKNFRDFALRQTHGIGRSQKFNDLLNHVACRKTLTAFGRLL